MQRRLPLRCGADLALDVVGQLRVVPQELLGVVAALAQADIAVVEPCTALLDDAQLDAQIDQFAHLGNALAKHDVELGLTERRCHLILHDLGTGVVADELAGGVLQTLHTADVDAHRGIILQRTAAGGDFGVAVDDADLLTQLVDEDADRVGLANDAGQFAHGLAHQAGLQADVAVAHLALDLGAGDHGGDRVHDDGVDGTGTDQRLADLHGVLDVDEGDLAALLLGLGQDVQGQRGLTAGFRAVHLDDTAARHTAHTQRHIQTQAAGGDGFHLHGGIVAQLHDGTLAELLFDLGQRGRQRVLLGTRLGLLGRGDDRVLILCCHSVLLCCPLPARLVPPPARGIPILSLIVYHKSRILQQEVVCFFDYFSAQADPQVGAKPRILRQAAGLRGHLQGFLAVTARSWPP